MSDGRRHRWEDWMMAEEDFDFWILAWTSGWKGVMVREEEGRGTSWWGNRLEACAFQGRL